MIELLAGVAAVFAVVEGVQSVSYAVCGLGRLAMRAGRGGTADGGRPCS